MAGRRHPVDVVTDDLVGVYQAGIRRLELAVRLGLERGLDPERIGTGGQVAGDASLAYRTRQVAEANAILNELTRAARGRAGRAVLAAYGAGGTAVQRTVLADRPEAALSARFAGVHQRTTALLAGNLTRSLEEATAAAGDNVASVFARATELAGGLPVQGAPSRNFIGRRVDDPWRRVALEELGTGQVSLDTRRQITVNLRDRLINEGIGDALTGYVDRAGRRWPLDHYAAMVARTTTREAASRGTVNRLEEHGLGLIEITSHPHAHDVCTQYEGHTWATSPGQTQRGRYQVIPVLPPFHPFCRHVAAPAGVTFEDFERELGLAASATA